MKWLKKNPDDDMVEKPDPLEPWKNIAGFSLVDMSVFPFPYLFSCDRCHCIVDPYRTVDHDRNCI